MGFILNMEQMDTFLDSLKEKYLIFAPKRFINGGNFSDTDCIRYDLINTADEIEFDEKSKYSFKEAIMPISQTLFYFTESITTTPEMSNKKILIFLRNCDLHAVDSLDKIYLVNGFPDHYYKKLRNATEFVVMGCDKPFENCFCVSMDTNKSEDYSLSIDKDIDKYKITSKEDSFTKVFQDMKVEESDVKPKFVLSNDITVNIPTDLDNTVSKSKMWDEYDTRCIACGRCNFVCPTCTCFTMQDIFYSENGKVGERRRIWASCMVDGYTNIAGGHQFRVNKGQRMRFKIMHKVLNFRKTFGKNMCVGCGRCDDSCPEYISFSNAINKLDSAMKEVATHE
ncbi:MAG: anaerobic sulfite reductase subunit A [Candidatus Epulonipiscioides saccharophilum]|nr:MAG: anaerobic sulfite reductase subunit A [Epulopiscium sp. AS2M-Bin001]